MIASDRLLTALGNYLSEVVDWDGLGVADMEPRVRDWDGTKGPANLVLDADEPEEHEVIPGVYAVAGSVCLELKARDFSENSRREILAAVENAIAAQGVSLTAAVEWLNDSESDRGIGDEFLEVYELRSDSGAWEVGDDWLKGEVGITAQFSGLES